MPGNGNTSSQSWRWLVVATIAAVCSFGSAQVLKPGQGVQAGKEIHVVVPMQMVMKRPEGRLLVRSYLIGGSSDGGRTWTFVDGARIAPDNIRKVLPNFNDRLKLPPKVPLQELK